MYITTCMFCTHRFFASSENVDATCNTEKDRTRVNHRTAGKSCIVLHSKS